ncbi:MAG: FKBP-type peptidyl-prolyl cis-trans isomerase FklB [Sulfurimonas sp.]|jgi:FKBP-type peptidyl-prolyl cis-trans isomerase FklB
MLKIIPTVIGCLGLIATSAMADTTLKTKAQKVGYSIGTQIGAQLAVTKDNIDLEALKLGMKDAFAGKKPKIAHAEMQTIMVDFQELKQKKELEVNIKSSQINKIRGAKYLALNKKKKGVITLPSGLQYKVLKSGTGKISPKKTDTVVTNYHGTLIDGTVFDSSYDRGETVSFPVNGVIPGWTEALQKMKVGDKWQIVIPSKLAYGEQGAAPSIGPDTTLIFDIELLEIK